MNQNLYMSTLLKAFDILDCFQNDRQELGISDIAAMVDMPVSSVHRIIQSLEFVGMLTQNRENRKYALGSRLLNLSARAVVPPRQAGAGRQEVRHHPPDHRLAGEDTDLRGDRGVRVLRAAPSGQEARRGAALPLTGNFPSLHGRVYSVYWRYLLEGWCPHG